jgi:sodium transport system permease protein
MLLPMSPGVELNLGNSLVPVTGLVLLLRSVIEGQYHAAWPFVLPVTAVTLACCLLAIRWAEEQFNRESVLFRESERLELRRWLMHVVRDRGDTPSFAQAMLCVAIILIIQFFISVTLSTHAPGELSFAYLARTLLVSQIGCIFAPVAIMTIMLTRRPARTLLLERWPRLWHVAAAAALAVVMHPLTKRLTDGIRELYPVGTDALDGMKAIGMALDSAPSWWLVVALMGLLPAICEELAFRGFVLSGLRHVGHKWWAIGISAVAFGVIHMLLQQKIAAATVGLVIGYLAVQTGSLVPCIIFHAIHNSLGLYVAHRAAEDANPQGWTAWLVGGEHPVVYGAAVVTFCAVCAAAILWTLRGAPYQPTEEEQLEAARHRQDASLAGA